MAVYKLQAQFKGNWNHFLRHPIFQINHDLKSVAIQKVKNWGAQPVSGYVRAPPPGPGRVNFRFVKPDSVPDQTAKTG